LQTSIKCAAIFTLWPQQLWIRPDENTLDPPQQNTTPVTRSARLRDFLSLERNVTLASGAVFLLVSHRPASLLPTIRSRCVAIPVPIPRKEAALQWLTAQGMRDAERWLAYAGGAPLRALDYAGNAALIERMLSAPAAVEDRDELELLAEALQKSALDRAFAALGGEAKYRTGAPPVSRARASAWLAYARRLGKDRPLCRHPLNPKLFSAYLIAAMPDEVTS